MRVLHFSDIHLHEPIGTIPLRDWLGKRLFGGANLLAGRQKSFAQAAGKVAALDTFRRDQQIDLVICTGDYTSLGTRRELRVARQAVEPLMQSPLGYIDVPGNHDIYCFDVIREGRFLESFGDNLATDLPEYGVEGEPWPFVRLVGDDVAVVGVDSVRPNRLPWRSSGLIPPRQLQSLRRVLADERVRQRFVLIITHYAARLADGGPDRPHHGLVNAEEFLAICADVPRGAILCGHVHRRYVVHVDGIAAPIFCAGSTTKDGVEGLWVFDVDAAGTVATPGRWREDRYELSHEERVTI